MGIYSNKEDKIIPSYLTTLINTTGVFKSLNQASDVWTIRTDVELPASSSECINTLAVINSRFWTNPHVFPADGHWSNRFHLGIWRDSHCNEIPSYFILSPSFPLLSLVPAPFLSLSLDFFTSIPFIFMSLSRNKFLFISSRSEQHLPWYVWMPAESVSTSPCQTFCSFAKCGMWKYLFQWDYFIEDLIKWDNQENQLSHRQSDTNLLD